MCLQKNLSMNLMYEHIVARSQGASLNIPVPLHSRDVSSWDTVIADPLAGWFANRASSSNDDCYICRLVFFIQVPTHP